MDSDSDDAEIFYIFTKRYNKHRMDVKQMVRINEPFDFLMISIVIVHHDHKTWDCILLILWLSSKFLKGFSETVLDWFQIVAKVVRLINFQLKNNKKNVESEL